jgi:hypothetical protein
MEKRYRGNEYTRNSRRIVGLFVFNVARVVSRKVYSPIVARQRPGKNPLIFARQRLGKIFPDFAR